MLAREVAAANRFQITTGPGGLRLGPRGRAATSAMYWEMEHRGTRLGNAAIQRQSCKNSLDRVNRKRTQALFAAEYQTYPLSKI